MFFAEATYGGGFEVGVHNPIRAGAVMPESADRTDANEVSCPGAEESVVVGAATHSPKTVVLFKFPERYAFSSYQAENMKW